MATSPNLLELSWATGIFAYFQGQNPYALSVIQTIPARLFTTRVLSKGCFRNDRQFGGGLGRMRLTFRFIKDTSVDDLA